MKKTILIIIIFINFNSLAQQKEFSLNKEKSIELRKTFGISFPSVYLLTEKEFSLKKFDTIKTLTKEYIEKQKKEEGIKKDSLNQFLEYSNLKKEYINLVSIKQNLDNFLSSNKRYKNKKQFLINAQNISDSLKTYKSYLYKSVPSWYIRTAKKNVIYADKNINSSQKRDFNEIKSDKNEFTEHITQISKRIESLREPSFNFRRTKSYSSINYSAKKIEKYNYELKEKSIIKISGFQITKPEIEFSQLNGNYKLIYNTEDLVGNFDNNQILLVENLKTINKSENQLKNIYNSYVFENVETKEIYYSKDKTVIENYSISGDIQLVNNKLKEKGFITKQIGSENYVIYQNKKIRINKSILKNISENNFNYLNKISKSIDEFNNLAKMSEPLTVKLNNKINSYRSGTLTKEKLKIWEIECKKGQGIIEKFKNIYEVEKYYFVDFIETEKLKNKNDLINSVLVSAKIIGM